MLVALTHFVNKEKGSYYGNLGSQRSDSWPGSRELRGVLAEVLELSAELEAEAQGVGLLMGIGNSRNGKKMLLYRVIGGYTSLLNGTILIW